ncbi:MAG: zinc ribbon domain-containing protein [Myxococcales bacterium FL481]|nr:MAG: zinc ribbon domain-containing protein [Myxococcales bacterium FL481]
MGTADAAINDDGIRRRAAILVVAPLGAAVCALAVAVLVFGADLNAPTIGLAIAAAALVLTLQGVYQFARSLATAEHDAVLDYFGGSLGPQAELRDERRRLLRAIKELDFDLELGKLSKKDHAAISTKYRLRAIELGRELDGGESLHPGLATALQGNRSPSGEQPPVAESARSGHRACPACGTENDDDARFCKACGGKLDE